jgi:hypothetical protein
LLVRKELLKFSPAELELIRSSGEENVGGIAALGKALLLLQRIGLDLIQEEEQALTGRLLSGLVQIQGIKIDGIKDPASPRFVQKGGVIVFSLRNILPDKVAAALAEQGGIGVRWGCHCAHLLIKRLLHIPPSLEMLQGLILTLFPQITLPGLVRASPGIENNEEDVDTIIKVLSKITQQPRVMVVRRITFAQNRTPTFPSMGVQQQMNDFARPAARRVYTPYLEECQRETAFIIEKTFRHDGLPHIVTDEYGSSAEINGFIDQLMQAALRHAVEGSSSPMTFLGVGGVKVFRDDIWGRLRMVFPADYHAFNLLGFYKTFPQHDLRQRLINLVIVPLLSIPQIRAGFNKQMLHQMILPLQQVVNRTG